MATTAQMHEMVLGNLVGTNFDGTAAIPNGLDGISLRQSAGNTIGAERHLGQWKSIPHGTY